MKNGKFLRLTQVYNKAPRIPFTQQDRLVFFSDVHRGNNSWADEFAPNQIIYTYAIQQYFNKGFTYIEVGDGDELFKFRHVDAIRQAHEHVYLILQEFHRQGRFYYLFGNHDIEYRNPLTLAQKLNQFFNVFTDETEVLFDDFKVYEGLVFTYEIPGVEFFVVHGHQGELLNDQLFWLTRLLLRGVWRPLQLLGIRDPTSVAQNVWERNKIERQLIEWVEKSRIPVICGHTHQERFPKKTEPPYFNTGSCVHPRWITCIEIENGEIALVRWRIKPRKDGTLHVKRDVIGGPKPLSRYAKQGQGEPERAVPVWVEVPVD